MIVLCVENTNRTQNTNVNCYFLLWKQSFCLWTSFYFIGISNLFMWDIRGVVKIRGRWPTACTQACEAATAPLLFIWMVLLLRNENKRIFCHFRPGFLIKYIHLDDWTIYFFYHFICHGKIKINFINRLNVSEMICWFNGFGIFLRILVI